MDELSIECIMSACVHRSTLLFLFETTTRSFKAYLSTSIACTIDKRLNNVELECNIEVTRFTVQTYIPLLYQLLHIFGFELDYWCAFLISDNFAVKTKNAGELVNPIVGCWSQKLQLDVSEMVKCHDKLLICCSLSTILCYKHVQSEMRLLHEV